MDERSSAATTLAPCETVGQLQTVGIPGSTPLPIGRNVPNASGDDLPESIGTLSGIARPMSVYSALSGADVSVRSDWSSSDIDVSPSPGSLSRLHLPKAENAIGESSEGNLVEPTQMDAIRSNYVAALSKGRHTLAKLICAKPIEYGVHSIQNLRREMEDAHLAVLGLERGSLSGRSLASTISDSSRTARSSEALPPHTPEATGSDIGSLSFFGVFDGHGGARAAEYAGEQMFTQLCKQWPTLKQEPQKALQKAIEATEAEWLSLAREKEWMDGTTAAVALVDRRRGFCIVGNVGDSEILLGTRLHDGTESFEILTEVHHLKRNPQESARVSEMGGRVWHGRLGHPTISPQVLSLSVSRAIGDVFFKEEAYTNGKASGLIADPFLTTVEVCGEKCRDQFLLVGCDGLWDTVPYAQACSFVFKCLAAGKSAQEISEGLTKLAGSHGSSDNITVILAMLCSGDTTSATPQDATSS